MLRPPRPAVPASRGLTRGETVWILVLTAAVVLLIVGTVRAELARARARLAEDTLHYLAGHLYLAMERAADAGEDPRAWSYPLAGPGAQPAGMPAGAPVELAEVLAHDPHLPPDPWGRAYVVLLAGTAAAPLPVVMSAGPDGVLPPASAISERFREQLRWPPRDDDAAD